MHGNVTDQPRLACRPCRRRAQAASIDLLAEHDIAVTTVAPGNREPLPLEALRRAGVRVGLGQDGIRDYWSPYGNGDMLERTWQLAYRAGAATTSRSRIASTSHRAADDRCSTAARGRRRTSSMTIATGLAVGASADLVIVPAETVTAGRHGPPTAHGGDPRRSGRRGNGALS